MLVGEAWGEQELAWKTHFVGPTGAELKRLCAAAGFSYNDCYATNVFHLHPPQNNLKNFCLPRRELPHDYPLTQMAQGEWLKPEYIPELDRLWNEITEVQPNIIIALGNTALWALTGETGIIKARGSIRETAKGHKMLATLHPASLFRRPDNRIILLADLIKAFENSAFSGILYENRQIWIEPDLEDLYQFEKLFIHEGSTIGVDIETSNGQITCIGLAASKSLALVLPFWTLESGNYWSHENEVSARLWLKAILENPHISKVMQNGIYDLQYLIYEGFCVQGTNDDTMIMSHILYPSMPKALGFLGATHTNSPPWKHMNPRKASDETGKREE